MTTFTDISRILDRHHPTILEKTPHIRSAVALVLRQGEEGIEALFMERASRDDDPWSGNIGFPGGKVEGGDRSPQQTAERESLEEIGLDLSVCSYLGRLSDIVGSHLPILVSCFVYSVTITPVFMLNHEVHDLFWVPLKELSNPERHVTSPVRFGGENFIRPAIRLPQQEKPLLWGITYRLVTEFLQLLQEAGDKDSVVENFTTMLDA